MIGYLSGIAGSGGIVLVNGVGYQVATPAPLAVGESVELWIHTAVRENDISLYGFPSAAERTVFYALTAVSGIGPKVALALLGLGVSTVVTAVRDKDVATLAQAPGIGPVSVRNMLASLKLPEALIAELSGTPDAPAVPNPFDEIVATLVALGYDAGSVRLVVEQLHNEGVTDEGKLLRRAMRELSIR